MPRFESSCSRGIYFKRVRILLTRFHLRSAIPIARYSAACVFLYIVARTRTHTRAHLLFLFLAGPGGGLIRLPGDKAIPLPACRARSPGSYPTGKIPLASPTVRDVSRVLAVSSYRTAPLVHELRAIPALGRTPST